MRFKNLEAVIARAQEIESELEDLLERDELTEEETARHDELIVETQELVTERTRLQNVEEARAAAREIAASTPNAVEDGSDKPPAQIRRVSESPYDFEMRGDFPAHPVSETRSRALRAVESESRYSLDDSGKERLSFLIERKDDRQGTIAKLVLATGSDVYRSAWTKVMSGADYSLTEQERHMLDRAASLADASGGFAVPFPIDPTLILTNLGAANPYRQISRVEPITTDSWQGISAGAVTASFDGEAAEVSDDTPTWTQPKVTAHKAQAHVPFSIEIGMDYPNFASDIAMAIQEGKDELEATKFTVGAGDGSNEPFGIVTALTGTGSVQASGTTDVLTIPEDLSATVENLRPKSRGRAVWIANLATYNTIREDTAATDAFWTSTAAGIPPTLYGRPAYEASDIDGVINAAADNYVAVFGDFARGYLIADRVGLSTELIPHMFDIANNLPKGQRGIYAYWRVGADSIDDGAFSMLNVT